jgi:hypothetical protein
LSSSLNAATINSTGPIMFDSFQDKITVSSARMSSQLAVLITDLLYQILPVVN